MGREKILHIEKLRGLSVLLVLLFHVQLPGFQNGFFGVDIFFVISGYLMATIYGELSSAADVKHYLLRRCSRILPAYYAVIAVTLVVSIFVLLPHEVEMVMQHSRWAVFLLPNIGFWLDAAYFDYTLLRPLLNLWSLGVEVQFYLLFPLLLILQRQSPKLLALVVVLSFVEYAVLSQVDSKSAFFLLPGRIWEFMLGFYAVQIPAKKLSLPSHSGSLALVALLLFLILAPSFEIAGGLLATCVVMVLTLLALSIGFSTGSEHSLLSVSLRLLGKYSYSIYLVHFPVIVFVNYTPFGGTVLAAASPLFLLVSLILTAVLSYLLFNFVEAKTRNKISMQQMATLAATFCLAVLLLSNHASSYNLAGLARPAVNISNALADRGSYQCKSTLPALFGAPGSCEVSSGLPGATRFLLAGDSHADGIKEPLASLLQAKQQTLHYFEGYRAINQSNNGDAVIAEAVNNSSDVIVLHSLPQPDHGAALEEFLINAQTYGFKVAFIAPVPFYEFDVPKKLFADYQAGSTLQRQGKSRQAYQQRNGQLLQRLANLEAQFSDFSWYPSADYLCQQHCYLSAEDWSPYYFDSNHLTLTGADRLQPVFEAISKL